MADGKRTSRCAPATALAAAIAAGGCAAPGASSPAAVLVRVTQDRAGDVVGADDAALRAAIARLPAAGGTVELGPGRYVLRDEVALRSGVTLRGAPGAVLAFPRPMRLTRPAAAGEVELAVDHADDVAPGWLHVLPPVADGYWEPAVPLAHRFLQVERVEPLRLLLAAPLPRSLPAGVRLGYFHKMLVATCVDGVVVEDLELDGGRTDGVPMPGHHQRVGIWIAARYDYDEGPSGEPSRDVHVRRCRFRGFYGRAVALYHTVDSSVEDCVVEQVDDEAISLDHFTRRCRVAGNRVRGARVGLTINDGVDHVVEHNEVADCGQGITVWWFPRIDATGLNERNVIRHNTVLRAREVAIRIGTGCRHNVVRANVLEGPVEVAEADNLVEGNERR